MGNIVKRKGAIECFDLVPVLSYILDNIGWVVDIWGM